MSDKKLAIKLSTLEAIGAAVRNKEGTTDLIPVNTLANRIEALPSGVSKLPQVVDKTITEITTEDLAGATSIGSYMFWGCQSLRIVAIPNGVTRIGNNAFYYCISLTDITIPDTIARMETQAFYACSNLTNVYYDGDIASWCNTEVTNLDASPLCYAGKLYIKNSGTNEYELLTNLVIPDSVTEIKPCVFYGYVSLTSVTIGNGVTSIDSNMLLECYNLIDFTISSPIVQSISFKHSTKLTIDSLKNIINALADYYGTDDDGKYTLTLNSACNATLEAEGATAPDGLTWREYAQFKGWNLV